MSGPVADRPFMPGYGVLPADEGSGLMAWAEAERRLTVSHDYWCATVRPGGRPHVMPVWGVWLHGRVWFSSGMQSRKARNLTQDPRCTLTTDDARDPVVVDGVATQVTDAAGIEAFVAAVNAKYGGRVSVDVPGPDGQRHVRRRPGVGIRDQRGGLRRQPDPVDVPGVSPSTSGMVAEIRRLVPAVQNLWGLTRRRALDFGRMTTAGC